MGILNAKHRIMDFILTDEGRHQISKGDLNISFASLSDRDTFYLDDGDFIAADAQDRIYFEVNGRHQDRIIVESSFGGTITSFKTAEYDLDGEEVATAPDAPRTGFESVPLTGNQASEKSREIITGITKNFYDNQLIGNEDIFATGEGFELSEDSIVFKPTNLVPINIESYKDQQGNYTAPYIEGFPTPLTDQKFAHLPHFSFLPPVNKSDSDLGGRQLGLYPNFNQAEILEYAALKETLESALLHEITFSTTSRDNNILIQPFEFHTSDGIIKKMDIIDFGTFPNSAGTSAQLRVFFVGKLTQDPVTTAWRFMNVFTLELDV